MKKDVLNLEDIELQLLNLLQTNWSVEKDTTIFHRNMRRVEGILTQPNVIIKEETDVNRWDTEGSGECLALITVKIRMQAKSTTNESVEETKELKHKFIEEIYDILKKVNNGDLKTPEGWEWGYITRRVNEDLFDVEPPMLGEGLNITIAYQRTSK